MQQTTTGKVLAFPSSEHWSVPDVAFNFRQHKVPARPILGDRRSTLQHLSTDFLPKCILPHPHTSPVTMGLPSRRAALATAASALILSHSLASVTARDVQAHPKHQLSKRAAPNLYPNTISTNDASQLSGKSYDYVVVS